VVVVANSEGLPADVRADLTLGTVVGLSTTSPWATRPLVLVWSSGRFDIVRQACIGVVTPPAPSICQHQPVGRATEAGIHVELSSCCATSRRTA
jgi:hypothetical protein